MESKECGRHKQGGEPLVYFMLQKQKGNKQNKTRIMEEKVASNAEKPQ